MSLFISNTLYIINNLLCMYPPIVEHFYWWEAIWPLVMYHCLTVLCLYPLEAHWFPAWTQGLGRPKWSMAQCPLMAQCPSFQLLNLPFSNLMGHKIILEGPFFSKRLTFVISLGFISFLFPFSAWPLTCNIVSYVNTAVTSLHCIFRFSICVWHLPLKGIILIECDIRRNIHWIPILFQPMKFSVSDLTDT